MWGIRSTKWQTVSQRSNCVLRETVHAMAELWGSEVTKDGTKEITMQCPFAPLGMGHKHTVDRNPNFSVTVSDNRSVCYCFACGVGGTVRKIAYKLWQETDNTDHKEAYKLAKDAEKGIFIPPTDNGSKKKEHKKDDSLKRILRVSQGTVSPILRARGITDADIVKWKLGFDAMENRDIFPIYTHEGELVAISGRRLFKNQEKKYYHYGIDPTILTEVYYGEEFVEPTVDEVILVEGPTDTIKVSRYYPNVFGQCGVQILTDERLTRLKRWFKTVTLLYDADAAGSIGMFKIGLVLFKHFVLFVALLPKGLDPFDASHEQIQEAMEKRILWSLIDWGEKGEKMPHLSE